MMESKFKLSVLVKSVNAFYKPEIIFENEDALKSLEDEPCVIICNHTPRKKDNFLFSADGFILRYVFKDQNVCSLVAKDLMDKPIVRLTSSGCNCIPVDRNAASISWIHDCVQHIKSGSSIIIFPEGTTFKDEDVDKFKPGFILLAKMANVKVLPVAINGYYELFTRGKLKINIGTPTKPQSKGFTTEAMENECNRFQQTVSRLYSEFENNQNIKKIAEAK